MRDNNKVEKLIRLETIRNKNRRKQKSNRITNSNRGHVHK